ncbi:DRTGG domain-containing protein [Gloeomargarita lithophora Alchichica-D10]|uniref:DRTGG domain-containing protein n=1 Tax=Gloeomargarita lithophora Alchichica-D10 TaxID=1188229 RepID=A0A1J0ABR1_9CYAN|nr:phosphotransacetylase family protein [Gloeomargarita lithophora]APB33380.1 DRTGG domain-containing protein [Gloeomargarita lithophora Alchichica-D10]
MTSRFLFVGSTQAYSGKSTAILGIAQQLQARQFRVGYGKPVGNSRVTTDPVPLDMDGHLCARVLNLPPPCLAPTLVFLEDWLKQPHLLPQAAPLTAALADYQHLTTPDVMLLEAPANLHEGHLFGLGLAQMAATLDAGIVLVVRFQSLLLLDELLMAQEHLGERLLGVLLNAVPTDQPVQEILVPMLEQRGIPVLGVLPRSRLLRSVRVGELAHHLQAQVVCCPERMDLLVEHLSIGAMSVNAALDYFRQGVNMVVITGSGRTDIQLAALEASTQCLVLTGSNPTHPMVLSRAEEMEIPLLMVDMDTLTAVETIERTFEQVRLQEPVKIQYVQQMMAQYLDTERLLSRWGYPCPSG